MVREEGGHLRLSGRKTAVEAAADAELLVVAARLPDGRPGHVLVPRAADGMIISPMTTVDLARRFYDVEFVDVQVDRGDLLTAGHRSVMAPKRMLHLALAIQASETAGVLARAFEITRAYLNDRYSFGRPLASYQALKHEAAELKLQLEACCGIATAAVEAVRRNDDRVEELVSAAKAYQGGIASTFIQRCVQLHGGIGVTWEHDMQLLLRRSMVNRVLLGTPSDHLEHLAVLSGAEAVAS